MGDVDERTDEAEEVAEAAVPGTSAEVEAEAAVDIPEEEVLDEALEDEEDDFDDLDPNGHNEVDE